MNDHSIGCWHNTRWLQSTRALDFHQAKTAGAIRNQLGVIAKGGYVKSGDADRIQNCEAYFDFNELSINY